MSQDTRQEKAKKLKEQALRFEASAAIEDFWKKNTTYRGAHTITFQLWRYGGGLLELRLGRMESRDEDGEYFKIDHEIKVGNVDKFFAAIIDLIETEPK